MNPYRCMPERARGLVSAVCGALALSWIPWVIDPGSGWLSAAVQSAVFIALAVSTLVWPGGKVAAVRVAQRLVINPAVRILMIVGLNPLGLVVLETTGRVSGRRRRTPVGTGFRDGVLWVIAEHGTRANYVRNMVAEPRVRVRVRRGWRHIWVDGVATVLPHDDPIARQRRIVGRNPLRAFNAMNVRLLGADLLTVRIDLVASSPRQGVTKPSAIIQSRATTAGS
ncbi:nitroreductase/quinone reductase family protein [Williamsia sp. M5A3_1d]